jgi:hypothetical protein
MAKVPLEDKMDFTGVRFNPLANYQRQIEPNILRRRKKVKDTNLLDDNQPGFVVGLSGENEILVKEDMAVFDYSKLITSAKNRNVIFSWNTNTIKLFVWLLFVLDYRSDVISLRPENMAKLGFKMAPATFRNSVNELERSGIIKRVNTSPKHENFWSFFINPQVIFKGDAKKFYNDVIKANPDYMYKSNGLLSTSLQELNGTKKPRKKRATI